MELETHYVKSSDFRTVLGTGVFGGVTTNGLVNANFFTDRVPLPTKISLSVNETTGEVGDELYREGKNGVIREVQFGVIMDVETARIVRDWLTKNIELIDANPPK